MLLLLHRPGQKRSLLTVVTAFWTAAPALAQADGAGAGKTFDLGQELALAGRGSLKGSVKAPGLEVAFVGRGVLRVVDQATPR